MKTLQHVQMSILALGRAKKTKDFLYKIVLNIQCQKYNYIFTTKKNAYNCTVEINNGLRGEITDFPPLKIALRASQYFEFFLRKTERKCCIKSFKISAFHIHRITARYLLGAMLRALEPATLVLLQLQGAG